MKRKDYSKEPVRVSGVSVEVQGNFERSLRQFSKKAQDAGVIKRCRDLEYYETPSEKKQRRAKAAKKRWAKQLSKMDPRNQK